MFVKFASDFHLEMTSDIHYIDSLIPPMDTDKDTVLALLGDIHTGTGARYYLKEMSKRFKAVIYVLGNHEFYHDKFYDLKHDLSDMFIDTNVYILENESVTIDDQKFVGCTLWTDMDKQNPLSIMNVARNLNDYKVVEGATDKCLKPAETIHAHFDSVNYLISNVNEDTIVLTHHAPITGCSHPQFMNSKISGGFESDLTTVIMDLQPKYWLYGHTHYNDGATTIDNTILLSNQTGYLHEKDIGDKYDPNMRINLEKDFWEN